MCILSSLNPNTNSIYNYANDAAIICLNVDIEGKLSPVETVGTLPRQHNRHFE